MENEKEYFKENYFLYHSVLDTLKGQQNALGFTNKDMARLLNIHPNSYERIIGGKYMMTVIQFIRICDKLGLNFEIYSPEETFGITVEHSKNET